MLTKDGMSVEPWDHPTEKTSLVSERTRIEAHFPVTALPSTTSLATGLNPILHEAPHHLKPLSP